MKISAAGSVREVGASDCTYCAEAESRNPFISHAFLTALEDSGSASAKSGWMAQHIVMRDDGRPMPGDSESQSDEAAAKA